MSKKATKKAVNQLQKILDFLGRYGGVISTHNPENWWDLFVGMDPLEETISSITDEDKKKIECHVGVLQLRNGDRVYDPMFEAILTMDGDRVLEVELAICALLFFGGPAYITGDDIFFANGYQDKAFPGIVRDFSEFMEAMTEIGPYLSDPKEVIRFTGYLSEM